MDSIAMSAPDGRASWNLIGPGGAHQVVQHTPRYVADDLLTLKFAAVAGTGICWLPDYMCQEEMRDRKLVRVLPDWAPRLPSCMRCSVAQGASRLPCGGFLDYLGETMPGRSSLATRDCRAWAALVFEVLGRRALRNAPSFPCGRSFRRSFGGTMQPIETVSNPYRKRDHAGFDVSAIHRRDLPLHRP
jgi:hypothetical protein